MAQKNDSITRVTFDMLTVDHKKLKMLAAYYGISMREILSDLIHNNIEHYAECKKDHTPNAVTKKAIESARTRKGSKTFDSVEALFKDLSE